MRTFVFSLIIFVNGFSSWAQFNTAAEAEQLVYTAFYNQENQRVIELGQMAIKKGLTTPDIYYRLGVVFYQMNHFDRASFYLDKAFKTLQKDPLFLEYAYYAHLFAGHTEEAQSLLPTMPKVLRNRIKNEPKFIAQLFLEGGVLHTNEYDKNKDQDLAAGNSIFSTATFYDWVYLSSVGVQLKPSARWTIDGKFTAVKIGSTDRFDYLQPNGPTTNQKVVTDFKNEMPYYQGNVVVSYQKRNWKFQWGGGLYYSTFASYTPVFVPQGLGVNYQILNDVQSEKRIASSLAASKRIGHWIPSVNLAYSTLEQSPSWMGEGAVTWYPNGTNTLFFQGKGGLLHVNNEQRSVCGALVGFKTTSKLWLELFGGGGNHKNFVSSNTMYTYNTPEPIRWYSGINGNYYLDHWILTLSLGCQGREGSRTDFQPVPNQFPFTYQLNEQTFTSTFYSIKTKITWKF
ncbi:MAG: hypothetical protein CFE24_00505 [Flavobacterium sp. BFFFF2]|nr:MAG: hypothetical protein CFE24_00505 [Flavobacterium sp. BFFFF2]